MFEQAFKNIDDVLWKEAGCTTELDYTEQTAQSNDADQSIRSDADQFGGKQRRTSPV